MWDKLPLRRTFRVVNGGTPTSEEINWNGSVPWATPVDLNESPGMIYRTRRTLTELGARTGSRIVEPNSILVSTRAPIGYVGRAGVSMAFNQGCRALAPRIEVDSRFFAYQLQSATQQLNSLGQGTTFQELSADSLAEAELSVPPLEEQRRIADFLDAETSRIEKVITAATRQVDLLRNRMRSLLDAELREHFATSKQVPMRYVFRPSNESGQPHSAVLSVYRDYGVILKDSRDDNFNKTPEDVDKYLVVNESDLVVNKMKAWQGSLGISSNAGIVSPDYLVLRMISGDFRADYLHYLLRSPVLIEEYKVRSKGIRPAQWRLYWDDLSTVPLPIVSERSQRAASDRFKIEEIRTSKVIGRIGKRINVLAERKQALITAAVTGQIDVTTAGRATSDLRA